LIRSLELPE